MRTKPFCFLFALTAVGVIASTCHDEEDPFRIPSEPQWSLLNATTVHDGLAWTSCFHDNGTESHAGLDWECARLKVPMNHDNEASPLTENNTVILALVKRKANKDEPYRGSILMNPGVGSESARWPSGRVGRKLKWRVGTGILCSRLQLVVHRHGLPRLCTTRDLA